MSKVGDYFEYERALWHESLLPRLRELGLSLEGGRVLDIGCGHGGMLQGLAESFAVAEAVGLDRDGEMIAVARARGVPGARFLERDLFAFDEAPPYDAVFLRDVLEHVVEPERAFARALALTGPGGLLFISYAPFYGPFGGHQHNGSGFFSNLPWLQALPEPAFRRLVRVRGNAYKGGERLIEDVESVLRTRLTLGRFAGLLGAPGLRVLQRRRWLVRPDYRLKFGLPPLALPPLPTPLAELLCTAEELFLRRS